MEAVSVTAAVSVLATNIALAELIEREMEVTEVAGVFLKRAE